MTLHDKFKQALADAPGTKRIVPGPVKFSQETNAAIQALRDWANEFMAVTSDGFEKSDGLSFVTPARGGKHLTACEFTIRMDAETIARIVVGQNGKSGYRILDGDSNTEVITHFPTSNIKPALEKFTEAVVPNMVRFGAIKASTNEL